MKMLYFVQQKQGDKPHLPLNVVESATFWAIFPDLKPITPKLLHKIQHYPALCVNDAENVAFFAGFARLMRPRNEKKETRQRDGPSRFYILKRGSCQISYTINMLNP